MPSSYTPRLRLVLPVLGELQGTWGDTVNSGITSLVDQAVAGTGVVSIPDANYTLTALNEVVDEARNMFLTINGALTANREVICPPASKLYFVWNNTSGGRSINFKTASGSGTLVGPGQRRLLQCNGTDVVDAINVLSGSATNAETAILANAATVLATPRNINGVAFDGSASIQVNTNTALTFNNTGSGDAPGTTFDGSVARTISFNTVGAPSTAGTGATGTWSINISGNAATVTNGAYLTGTQTFTGLKTFGAGLNMPDNITLRLGTANIATLYNTGTDTRLDMTTGNFVIRDAAAVRFTFTRNSGTFSATGDITAGGVVTGTDVVSTSDRRLKSDLKVIQDAVAKVCCLTGYTYTKEGAKTRQTGLIAQDVQQVLPEAVNETGDFLALSYGSMMGLVVEALKEIVVRLDKLEAQVHDAPNHR